MSLPRIFSTAIVLLSLLIGTKGQVPSDAILVDELGPFPCDGFRGWIDILLTDLRDHPESKGIVLNVGRGEREISAVIREEMIRNHILFRGFDASRIRYAREIGGEFKTKLFRIPGETAIADSKNYVLTTVDAPSVLEEYNFDDLCPPYDMKNVVGTLLEHNPRARVTIVVREETVRQAREKEREITAYLANERHISRSRFVTFLTVQREINYGTDPIVEYTYIP